MMPSEPSTSSLFPCLRDFEAKVFARPEVLGVLYTGSLGRGTFDRFSDLDIELWIDEPALELGVTRLRELMGWLGPVHFIYSCDEASATGSAGPDWRRVDLYLKRRSNLKPDPSYVGARVIKDTDGILARLVAESVPEEVTATAEEGRRLIEGSIDSQIYLSRLDLRFAM